MKRKEKEKGGGELINNGSTIYPYCLFSHLAVRTCLYIFFWLYACESGVYSTFFFKSPFIRLIQRDNLGFYLVRSMPF